MNVGSGGVPLHGIRLHAPSPEELAAVHVLLDGFGLCDVVEISALPGDGATGISLALNPVIAAQWLPDGDTVGLARRLELDTLNSVADLEKEILVALLGSPLPVDFPSVAELLACIHIRRNIVTSGRRTELNFDTAAAERPSDCWCDDDQRGFTVRAGCPVIKALKMATQPELSGHLYSFSCYRATEYVILLAIAKELAVCNPVLLSQLQEQCECRMIRSGQFHDVFLHEYGSQESPFPTRFYVPGDRVWFRNPDAVSSDIVGYEGSWVLYLGDGLFTNFWKHNQPYTLDAKCVEIYHWRHGAHRNDDGELVMDEAEVERWVAATYSQPDELRWIRERMMRWRDSKGVYAEGGCIDTTREGPRWVCPGTADLVLPLQ